MMRVPASGPVIRGIDIYHANMISNLNALLSSGIQYVMMKVFELQEDATFPSRWKLFEGKVVRGAYDFYHPELDPISQANSTVADVGPLTPGDMPIILDWEKTGGNRDSAYAWLCQVEKLTGKSPIIYGSPYFLQAFSLDARFKRFGLWVAEYGCSSPLIPAPWSTWNFWQTSGTGAQPGISGQCDLDVFNGTIAQLQGMIAASKIS